MFTYDLNDRITQIRHAKDAAMLFDAQFGYDPAGNRLWLKDNARTGRDELYEYDNLNRLRGFERGALNANFDAIATPLQHEFIPAGQSWAGAGALDRRGNWLDSTVTVGSPAATVDEHRTVNGVNEYLTATIGAGSPQDLTHDNNGNLTHNPTARNIDAPCDDRAAGFSPRGSGDCATGQRYEYDEENRLTEVHRLSNDEFLLENKYDALGRRIESVDYLATSSQGETVCGAGGKGGIGVSPVVTRYIYAGLETLEEHTSCDAGLTWALAREFLWGDRFPEPLAMIDHTDLGDVSAGTEEVLHYIHDALGSVVALTDANGTEVERYTYAPYGPTYIEDPQTGDRRAASSYGNPWMWTGQRYDAGVNLYHFQFRAYSPRLGRWLQRDPLGYVDGVSLYQYVASMPTFWIDPEGLDPCDRFRRKLDSLRKDRKNAVRKIANQRNTIREIERNIANHRREIEKRERALARNPRDLPQSAPGDDERPRLSRAGHQKLLAVARTNLAIQQGRLKTHDGLLKQAQARLSMLDAKIAVVAGELAACEKAEKKAEKKAKKKAKKKAGKIVTKVAKRGLKTAAGKIPVVGVCFFAWDWRQGGFCHAVNEACWPISEIWD